ncbi:MAG TPA: hypothetical protein VN540_08700 [Clostridia bacterium]|nr:hypothetical protein [Clostridia bacterium]
MFDIYPFAIFMILLVAALVLCLRAQRKGEGAFGVMYVALFMLALYGAFLLKRGNAAQAVDAFVPFYKIVALREYGYASILRDLLAFAAPFALAGLLIIPAFPRAGLFWAFVAGVCASLAFNVYPLFNGMSFVTDEYVYAGVGLATGASIYVIIASLLKKRLPLDKLRLPVPLRRRYVFSAILFAAVYFGVALVMVFDYGETYAPVQFFESDTPLPGDIALECELSDEAGRANIYIPSTASAAEKAAELADKLGIAGEVAYQEGTYTVGDDAAKLTLTESGSWVYEFNGLVEGELPTPESAKAAAFAFFDGRGLMTVDLFEATDIVVHNAENGAPDGYEVYLSTAVSGMPLVGSSTLVVSVRAGDAVVKIRRYDGDVLASTIVNIISQQKAYEKIAAGECAYTLFAPALSARIQSCRIIYMANSSQGYYLPVWMFTCEAQYEDGTAGEFYIYVEAMK